LTLARDDLVLYLATHGNKEGWRSLIWVCDFAELLRTSPDINWTTILDRARESHSLLSLQVAIVLASTLLDAPAPASIIDLAKKNWAVRALVEKATHRIQCSAPAGELEEFLDQLSTYDGLRQKLWPITTLLTTRTVSDYRAMPLPKSLWGFYYFTRPFRLASKIVTERFIS
jgi:putative nucleotidyltransferase-like protein